LIDKLSLLFTPRFSEVFAARSELGNRFNGFAKAVETAQTINLLADTSLKRGVNENAQRAST
jgi:hypothetical protein